MHQTGRVAVVIPQYRENIFPDEETSLRHLKHFLSGYPHIIIRPAGLLHPLPGYESVAFSDDYFTGVDAYSKLLLSPSFYETFCGYEYILIYQLDCLVLSSDLDRWCDAGYDYIGAPLFRKNSARLQMTRTGNGGFSLRRVQGFLDVLRSERYLREPVSYWRQLFFTDIPDLDEFAVRTRWRKKSQILRQVRRGVTWYTQNYSLNEDLFWSDRAQLFHPAFKIASLSTALEFAFERNPGFCYEQNDHRVPFGCHAWAKWDRAFWESHLLC